MNIAALPSMSSLMPSMRATEAMEGPGPDHDGDADDAGAASKTGTSSALPANLGNAVDIAA